MIVPSPTSITPISGLRKNAHEQGRQPALHRKRRDQSRAAAAENDQIAERMFVGDIEKVVPF